MRFSIGFGLMATCRRERLQRELPIRIAISDAQAAFDPFGLARHRCRRRDYSDVGVIVVTRLRPFVHEYERSRRYREISADRQ